MSKVRIFKMASGEEVLTMAEPGANGDILFNKPRAIQVVRVNDHGVQISLIPWIITDPDSTQSVSPDRIMCYPSLSSELEKTYLEQTSGIILT